LARAEAPAGEVKKSDEPSKDGDVLPNPPKKYAWALLGGAAGSLVIGISLGAVALGRSSEQNGDPSMPPIYTSDLHDRGREGQAMSIAAYAFITFGIVLGVLDVIMWFEVLRKPRKMETTKTAAQAQKPQLRAGAGGLEVRF
jgi:hypothetical protein